MELKSFGNMYYLDENGDTLIYPQAQVRWEWKSNNSNRWYAFEYLNSVELEKKYQDGGNSQLVTLSGESGYELKIEKNMESSNIDNTESKVEFKENLIVKKPKLTGNMTDREEFIVRRSLIQWFRRGGATYEIYDEKFNKDIETELFEKQEGRDITFNYNGVNLVDIKKENEIIIDNGIVNEGKRGEYGQKSLIRARVVWFLDNNELPDFMCKKLEQKYREINIAMMNIPLSDLYEDLFNRVRESMSNSITGLENNLLIKKEIDGWILFYKGSSNEGNNPKFYRGYTTTFEVKPPYKLEFPPSPDAEEEEDDQEKEEYRPKEVILRIQKDEELSKTIVEKDWVTEEWTFNMKNGELSIKDQSLEVEEILNVRQDLEPMNIKEFREIKGTTTTQYGKTYSSINKEEKIIALKWLSNSKNQKDTLIYRVKKLLGIGK